jgi:2-polyprenyl-3-methyl-5-hydroxy-6-metoxy-1,4-benzoquinol methylase
MTTTRAGLAGLAPRVNVGAGNPEALKYGEMWKRAEYRVVAPGESLVPLFLEVAKPSPHARVLDFGCGTGRAAFRLATEAGLAVTMLDFVSNALDPHVRDVLTHGAVAVTFLKHDVLVPIPVTAPYGVAFDLLEHIPEAQIDDVLVNLLKAAQHVFFSISTVEDRCGALIGERLHMTVRPYAWWLTQFARHEAVVHWSRETDEACYFYVSAWRRGREVVKSGVLNAAETTIRENVAHNIAQGWAQVHPHGTTDTEVVLLGGGPSLADSAAAIHGHQAAGAKLVTLNGAYHWAREQGLWPVTQILVDARPFNARFTKPVDPRCLYLLASQCHPSVFEGLPRERTYLYHTLSALVGDLCDAQYGPGGWHPVPGGSTVLLRAIPLLRMLGYQKFHLYGCDSCLGPDQAHHAYAQPENDHGLVLPVTATPGGRIFYAYPWMISQAQEFLDLIAKIGDVIELAIYGDGLLAYLLHMAGSLNGETVGFEWATSPGRT